MSVKTIKSVIKKHKNFLVSAHINPEGDSVGSQIALSSLLKRLGKKVFIINESPVPRVLRFMKGADDIQKKAPEGFDFQAAIILDCPSLERIGKVSEYVPKDKIVINIDHHISNENFGKYNWVDVKASSAGEMVFKLFKAFRIKPDYDEAISIYTAIMTDTGSFRYTNTSSGTHMITAELINRGVQPYDIYSKIYETAALQDTQLLADALGTLKVSEDGKIAWLWVTKEMLKNRKASLEGTEGVINFARSIEGVKIAVFFRETGTENRVKVSFRSKDNVDVNKLASFFGGGGHVSAGGCSVLGSREEVEKKVFDKAKQILG